MKTPIQAHVDDPMVEQRKQVKALQLEQKMLMLSHLEEFLAMKANTDTPAQ